MFPSRYRPALGLGVLLGTAAVLPRGPASAGPPAEQNDRVARPADAVRKDAARFADWVLDATRILSEGHIKRPDEREMVAWAARGAWEQAHPTVPPELRRLLDRVGTMSRPRLRALLIEVRAQLGHRPELAEYRDMDAALRAIFRRLEPGATLEPLAEQMNRPIICFLPDHGIGVKLRPHPASRMPEVETPILDGPAYRAGLQTGDVIARITLETDFAGKPLPEPFVIATKGLSVEEANRRLLGQEGTRVKLTVRGLGAGKEVTLDIVRGRSKPETVLGARRTRDDHWSYFLDPAQKIAYIRLAQFSWHTRRDLADVMKHLSAAGLRGLILDLRSNTGGVLDAAVKTADLFVGDEAILTIRPRHGPEICYVGQSKGSYTGFPMVCLVDGESRRVTEVVAACLQDHGRAIILGERTPGETSIRSNMPLSCGGSMQFTMAVYVRGSGRNLSKLLTDARDDEDWGVRPDKGFALPLSVGERAALRRHLQQLEILPRRDGALPQAPPFHDRLLETALVYLREQIVRANRVNGLLGGGPRLKGPRLLMAAR